MTDTPADLREQIAKALAEKDGYVWLGDSDDEQPLRRATYLARAAAVLAVLPEGFDRFVSTIELLRDRLADTTTERDEAREEAAALKLGREQWARQTVPYSGQLQSEVSELLRDWSPGDGPREVMADQIATHMIVRLAPLLATKDDLAEAAQAELERLHSWAGLMELLDEHWPADIFPGPENGAVEREDDGPRVVSLIRALDKVGASRRDWAAEAMRLDMAQEATRCTGARDCHAEVHHEGCFYSESEFCCDRPRPTVDAGEPDEHVTTCGNCGEDMDADMLDRLRYSPLGAVLPDRGGDQ